MICAYFEERIALFVRGDLPSHQIAEVEKHLAHCSNCQVLARELRDMLQDLALMGHDLPESRLLSEVRMGVHERIDSSSRLRGFVPWVGLVTWPRVAFAGVGLAAVLVLVVLTKPNAPTIAGLGKSTPVISSTPQTAPSPSAKLTPTPGIGESATTPSPTTKPLRRRPANRSTGETLVRAQQKVQPAPVVQASVKWEETVFKIITDDPDVVIYWIADVQGGTT